MTGCPGPDEAAGAAQGMLASVGCNAHVTALKAYAALTGPSSFLPGAITACLTIYVALLGYGLLTGSPRVRLSQVSATGLKIGAVLALSLNWSVFQTLVFNVAAEAPFEVGKIFAEPGTADEDPLSRLEAVRQEFIDSARSLAAPAAQAAGAGQGSVSSDLASAAAPQPPAAQTLTGLASALILCTAGLVALAMVAQAVLTALGPVFILCFLFDSTRGLFVGWVRALAGAVIAPVTTWGGLMIGLGMLEPWAARLADERNAHAIRLETISSLSTVVTTFAAAQVATALGAVVIAAAFSLPRGAGAREGQGRIAFAAERPQAPPPQQRFESRAGAAAAGSPGERSLHLLQEGRRMEVFPTAAGGRPAEAPGAVPRLGDAYRRLSPAGRLARAAEPTAGGRP